MEDVARRRVVNDDALADRAAELGQILFARSAKELKRVRTAFAVKETKMQRDRG